MKSIAVFGLGFVGLPLSLTYSLYGVKVYGVDINEDYLNSLRQYKTHILEDYKGKTIEEILKASIEKGLFVPTTSPEEAMANVSEIIVTVGIPIEGSSVKTEVFENAIQQIGKNLKKGDLVLIRSTVPPGTTREVALPILQRETNLVCGKDFYLAYSSERIAEGNAFDEFQTMPIAVAGIDAESTRRAKSLLNIINKDVIEASSPEIVEVSKVIENSSRDVNIALVNELATFTEHLGLDVMEVIRVANTHKRVKLLSPGIGVGGHCIPYSSKYIFYKSDKMGLKMDLLHSARNVNDERPVEIANMIERTLTTIGKDVRESTVAFVGIAMKDNSSDVSESPTLHLMDELRNRGVKIRWFDPNVKSNLPDRVDSFERSVEKADVVVIPIRQNEISYDIQRMRDLMKESPVLFDAKRLFDKEKATRLGFIYLTI
ncbi:MAG: nucleotide sugar dehydrogenase [Caldisericaceae bacterium]